MVEVREPEGGRYYDAFEVHRGEEKTDAASVSVADRDFNE